MSFKYEIHLHSYEGSACAHSKAADLVDAYKESGYTGIIITDHFFNGNCRIKEATSWKERVHKFCEGYELAKNRGEQCGLDVFFGWEASYYGTDFLIYGLDEQFLMEHENIHEVSIEEQFKTVDEAGGLVIQAHPFRQASYIKGVRTYPDCVHAVEVLNRANELLDYSYNTRALDYAKKYQLTQVCGSDAHSVKAARYAMYFEKKLTDIQDFVKTMKSGTGFHMDERVPNI